MARHKFTRTDETFDVLRNHVIPIAKEYGCDDSYIYSIKNGDSNDIYGQFRHLFNSAARAGAPAEVWLRDLAGILEKLHSGNKTISEIINKLSEKILADAAETSEILDAIADHELDKRECHKILAAVEVDIDLNSGIKRLVQARLAELSEQIH